ncbi:MAG: menaquinone biosynthesis protein [Phycisphaeraceae bacterium]|nr:menaquinone biosynthesis protein [Phycisphaerales bacterium]MCB9860172.1 menaquinone biosynthesis protein [Phycisphaeraceae bacterium]
MTPVRIACVRYLNTLPLIEGLDVFAHNTEMIELVATTPSRIGAMVASGEADLGLVSVIDAARLPTPMAQLPVGMIGSDGPTMTVRLFSDVPIDQITTLHADVESHTSVALARVLLNELHAISPIIVPYDAREGIEHDGDADRVSASLWPESLLLIGDKVVCAHLPEGRYIHQLDLGETWKNLTGLSFVYATWMCPRDRTDDPAILSACALLDRQRRHNTTRLDWVAQQHAHSFGWDIELARNYLGRMLRYSVGNREQEAARLFIEKAHARGLVDRSADQSLCWVDAAKIRSMCVVS